MPNVIDKLETKDGTFVPDNGSTDQEELIVSGTSDEDQYIVIIDEPSRDLLGVSPRPVNGRFSIPIKVSGGRAYKIVADTRAGGLPSNVWSFRVGSIVP